VAAKKPKQSPKASVSSVGVISLPGSGGGWVKLKGDQGWRNADGSIWKKDMKHKDHWDVSDAKGNKIKEVDFHGVQIWPAGPKNKNKKPK
jgi:hypothetical protein